jgi:PAS domain S-box-containing protein
MRSQPGFRNEKIMTTKRQSDRSVSSFYIRRACTKTFILFLVLICLPLVPGQALAKAALHGRQESRFQGHMSAQTLLCRRVSLTQLLSSRIVDDQSYALWGQSSRNQTWLMRICVLQILIIGSLIWGRTKRNAAERKAAGNAEFQEILKLIAAEHVSTQETSESGEIRTWSTMFLHYFGFEWMSLLNLAEEEASTLRLVLNAAKAVTPGPSAMAIENTDIANLDITVLGGGRDEILKSFPDLAGQLRQNDFYSFLILPLRVQGELIGALICASAKQELPRPAKLTDQLQILANIFANQMKRTRSEQALQASKELNASMLASSMDSVAVIDRAGTILAVNQMWSQLNSDNSIHSVHAAGPGTNYLAEWEASLQHGDNYAMEALAGIKDVLKGKRERFEMTYARHSHDVERWFSMVVTGLNRADGGAVVTHIEITERVTAGLKLYESEHRFHLMADTAPVMIWMAGLDRLYTYFNRGWLDFTGRTLEQELGNGWVEGVHPSDLQKCMQTYFAAFNAQQKFSMEYRLRRSDGQYRWIIDSGVPRFANDSTFAGYIGCCFDITDRKELAAARTEFAGKLIKAQEKERERIARELHDDIGQRLALVAIEVQQLDAEFAESREAIHTRVHNLWNQITDISSDAGRISHQLHSSKLKFLGLVPAIRSLCADFSRQHQLTIHCTCTAIPEQMDNNISLGLFRVAQEALHNIVRHSHAKNAIVDLAGQADEIHLHISDDGTGFDIEAALAGESLGLISMEERLRLVGGTLTVKSNPSFGTRIDAWVPIAVSSRRDSVSGTPRETAA